MNPTPTLLPPSISMDSAIANLQNVAELLKRLGDIPPDRIRLQPYPGTAPEKDALAASFYTNPDSVQEIGPDGTLDGGDVLPGFALPLQRLFDRAGRQRGA